MNITQNKIEKTCLESEIIAEVLSLDDKHILELGCGTAELTRSIAEKGKNTKVTALEVDKRQHEKNLSLTDLPNVSFQMGGAEAIPVEDQSQDIVFMFKSLHHVPEDKLGKAMLEISRVLKPGGIAYISEPIFDGDFNELIRLFHNEEMVRQTAFNAIEKTVSEGVLSLNREIFFNTKVYFENFSDFESKVLNVSHTNHQLSNEIFEKVREQFNLNLTSTGAYFTAPMRVDLLQKPM